MLHLPDLKFISRLDMNAKFLPIDITWVDNKRLVMGTGEGRIFEAPSPTGDIIAVDIDGKNKRVLYSDSLRGSIGAQRNILKLPPGFGTISGLPDQRNGHFYLTVNPAPEGGGSDAQAHKTLIFDIDALSGSVNEIGGSIRMVMTVVHDGTVRYAYGQDNDFQGTCVLPRRQGSSMDGIVRIRRWQAHGAAAPERRRQTPVRDRQCHRRPG